MEVNSSRWPVKMWNPVSEVGFFSGMFVRMDCCMLENVEMFHRIFVWISDEKIPALTHTYYSTEEIPGKKTEQTHNDNSGMRKKTTITSLITVNISH